MTNPFRWLGSPANQLLLDDAFVLKVSMLLGLLSSVVRGGVVFRTSALQDDLESDLGTIESRLGFMHIPKNGGTAIEDAGLDHGVRWGANHARLQGRRLMPDGHLCSAYHVPIGMLETLAPEHASLSYAGKDVFCIVRDPVQRALSEYMYLLDMMWGRSLAAEQHTELLAYPACSREGLNEFTQTTVKRVRAGEPYIDDCHHLPQARFIWDSQGRQRCKHIFRMENLSTSFNAFMAAFGSGIRLQGLHHTSMGKCPNISAADMNASTLTLLAEVYSDDFRLLGYPLPS